MGREGSFDLLVSDGRFEAVAPHIEAEAECVDLGGQLVIPPYVEPHIHLDAVYAGGTVRGRSLKASGAGRR